MKYIEVSFTFEGEPFYGDILIDTLGNEGPYDSFVETDNGLKAYVPAADFDQQFLETTVAEFPIALQYNVAEMEDKDWNEEWERQHESVVVQAEDSSIYVRAPFHQHRTDVDYEIVIEPKMSFGTAHHPTTYMMLSYVAEVDVAEKSVLDMGCGTAVLAILSKMRGARSVTAIDIDQWAFDNAQENVGNNGVELECRIGDASLLDGSKHYDIILANINRNILLRDMEAYKRVLNDGGRLIISGFYESDSDVLLERAAELGLAMQSKKVRQDWCSIELA